MGSGLGKIRAAEIVLQAPDKYGTMMVDLAKRTLTRLKNDLDPPEPSK